MASHNPPSSSHPFPDDLTPLQEGDPRILESIQVVGRLGEGRVGSVYGGVDAAGNCVAVKIINPELAAEPEFRSAFTREVELLAQVDGVCVPPIRGSNTEAPIPWLAIDYVPGRDLSGYVRDVAPLDGDMLLSFAAGTAEALAAMHAVGIVHGGLTPGDVILSPAGPRVVGLGSAGRGGSPGWMAPERDAGAPPTPAGDVFGWGGLVILAGTGRAPFAAGPSEERDAPDLDALPDELAPLVRQALRNDPEQRPTAFDLLGALLEPQEEVEYSALPALSQGLRSLLHSTWAGFTAAGHSPTAWATVAGATATAAGAGAVGGAAGAAGGSAGAGGTIGGLFTVNVATVTAGAVTATAVLAGGGYFAWDTFTEWRAREANREMVRGVADLLASGRGFAAEVSRTPTPDAAEAAGAEHEVRYSTEGERTVYITEGEGEDGQELVANVDGNVFAYATGFDRSMVGEFGSAEYPSKQDTEYEAHNNPARFPAESYAVELLTGPVWSLAEADDLTNVDDADRRFTGTVNGPVTIRGELTIAPATGELLLDESGAPQHLEYTTEEWTVSAHFTAVDDTVEIEEPIPDYTGLYGDTDLVLTGPVCGQVEDADGAAWNVRVDTWEITCEEAMDVAMTFEAGEGEGGGIVSELEDGSTIVYPSADGGSYTQFIDGMACTQQSTVEIMGDEDLGERNLGPCNPASEAELDDPDISWGEQQVWEIDHSRRLLSFHLEDS